MYHYVRPDDSSLPHFRHLHIDDFVKQLEYFGNEYGFIGRNEFEESIKSNELRKGVVLTFDDGFKDHYTYVLPELKKRGLWGIFYIAMNPFVAGKLLNVHRIHMLTGKYGGREVAGALQAIVTDDMLSHQHVKEFHTQAYKLQDECDGISYVKRCLNYLIDYRHRDSAVDQLMAIFYPKEQELVSDFYMTRNELREMHGAGMMLGSHTVTHPVMSKLSLVDQEKEIVESFLLLERMVGAAEMRTFCYPHGGFHTFTPETEGLLEGVGCHFSFNVELRDINIEDIQNRKQALPRYDCNQFPYGACRGMSA